MRPLANWQSILQAQVTRGLFFMHPQMAIGMGKYFSDLFNAEVDIEALRPDFEISARSYDNGESFSKYDDAPEGSVAIFSVRGPMLKYGTWYSYGTEEIAEFIRQAIHHKNISAIVIEYDSGGGLVSAVAPMSNIIREAKAAGKAVVSCVDMCCSAAYWNACEADLIIANNKISSEVGSIGVMMDFWDIVPYYEKEGLVHHTIISNHSEDKNKPFRLALKGDYDLIQKESLDPLAFGFQNHVKEARAGKLVESTPGILSGRTFYAEEAKAAGLIDEIGDLNLAIERAQQLSTVKSFSI